MDLGTTTCTWSSPKFLITYNLNGGANSGSTLNVHELKESGEFLNDGATLTNPGFVFAGWNTASDGSGTNYPIVQYNPFYASHWKKPYSKPHPIRHVAIQCISPIITRVNDH